MSEENKTVELEDKELKQVTGGTGETQEPSSSDWTVCPSCGGVLEPYDMATAPWPQYKCRSCGLIFDDKPVDPENPGGKIYL